jgi:hypothetical protein
MQRNLPLPTTAPELTQHLVAEVDLFFKQHPMGNDKNWNDLTARLLRWVQRMDTRLAFDGLLWVLEHQTRYQYQLLVGELLQRASVDCTIPLEELLGRVLPNFEESAHSVPLYLRRAFGKDGVLTTLQRIEDGGLGPALLGKVKTMRYWMDAPTADGPSSKWLFERNVFDDGNVS